MANLSSDTLFHFTSSLDVLQKILSEGIRFGMFAEKLPVGQLAYFVRGISFCNIPLSMISEHVNWYGKYAIGIKRSYLRKLGVSPVFYVHSKSPIFRKGKNANSDLLKSPFLCYLKQHYGKQYHKESGSYKYKKFIDEKEWRVFSDCHSIEHYSSIESLDCTRKKKDETVKYENPLTIKPEMIEYIILETPKDFTQFDLFLRNTLRDERDNLLTKILYYSQIKKDF